MGRMGLAELRNALYPDSNVSQTVEQGVYGTLSAGEVADVRRGEELRDTTHNQEHLIDDRLSRLQQQKTIETLERDMER